MKFSEQWLREWIDPALSTEALAHRLTMAGLEVDAIDAVAGEFSCVVVGEVLSVSQHPDADKLRVCEVSTGQDTYQVVCGADNVRAGLKVPFALVGAVLPGGLKIKKAKLRGVESSGMLCAEQELGLSDASAGLLELPADAPTGKDLRDYLQLDDRVIELGVTPNRADCLSIRGIARDLAAVLGTAATEPALAPQAARTDATFPVAVHATADCPRYLGRVVRGVDISRPTPLWMQEKLRRAGIRSIDAVVDITNYVLLELGQPMHAFDLARLRDGIVVRHAEAGETLVLLNGQTIKLAAGDLVIADASGPLALAGIMGGSASAVDEQTRDIFLESAHFNPERLAGRARRYGLHTDSSHRFERGVDPELPRIAMERATELLLACVGGEPGPVTECVDQQTLPRREPIALRGARIQRLLGVAVSDQQVETLLGALGLELSADQDGWRVQPPSWRFDLALEVDLIEELARLVGYEQIPARSIQTTLALRPQSETRQPLGGLRQRLIARGYQEAVTYSFIDRGLQSAVQPELAPAELVNPISAELSVMRTSLMSGLLRALSYNLNRQQYRVRLFETGLRFLVTDAGLKQTETLALLASGRRAPESWSESGEAVDFYDLKGDLETVAGAGLEFARGEHPALHPGQCAAVHKNGHLIGHIGTLHPDLQRRLDIDQPVVLAELDLAPLLSTELPRFKALSRFPEVRRDIAVVVDRSLAAADLLAIVRDMAGDYLTNLRLFDTYEGKGIDPQRKSLGLGLTFQHSSRTLNEDEINDAVARVVAALNTHFGATLRN